MGSRGGGGEAEAEAEEGGFSLKWSWKPFQELRISEGGWCGWKQWWRSSKFVSPELREGERKEEGRKTSL